jgi:hypothetical protein
LRPRAKPAAFLDTARDRAPVGDALNPCSPLMYTLIAYTLLSRLHFVLNPRLVFRLHLCWWNDLVESLSLRNMKTGTTARWLCS